VDKVCFFIAVKKKREVQDPYHGEYFSESNPGEPGTVDLADPDLFKYIKLIAGDSTCIDSEPELAVAFCSYIFIKGFQMLYPC